MVEDTLVTFFQALWGPHYTINCVEIAESPFRAIVWIISNLFVTFAYIGIPREINVWNKVLQLDLTHVVARLFRAFIVYCGISHVAMIFIMPTASWMAIGLVFMPLAVVSFGTWVVLRYNRKAIVEALTQVKGVIT